jgi:hypothetical protein
MSRNITINCSENTPSQIQLVYTIETLENLQTITCSVNEKRFPIWLQLRKFEMQSLKEKSGYTPLYNEVNNSKNMATALFIDQVYTDIMLAEKLVISKSAAY